MSDLFDNPMVRMARKALPKEKIERMKFLGESMFTDIDFEKTSDNNLPSMFQESINYIDSMIKSGLHPSMLSKDEKILMKETIGEKWYEKYGYNEKDLDEIFTLKI